MHKTKADTFFFGVRIILAIVAVSLFPYFQMFLLLLMLFVIRRGVEWSSNVVAEARARCSGRPPWHQQQQQQWLWQQQRRRSAPVVFGARGSCAAFGAR